MKVFLSSTYNGLIEHHKAAHDEIHPRIKPRTPAQAGGARERSAVQVFTNGVGHSNIRVIFVDGIF